MNTIPSWTKTVVRRSILKYRKATRTNGSLPDFIIIGAQKSGTTSLHHYLSQHPDLVVPNKKEIHFFDGGINTNVDNFNKGEAWYRSHFPLAQDLNDNQKIFETSPLYIFNPLVPKRIFELVPKIKLIVILRNPTERAISHYFHVKRKGLESKSILEAFEAENDRLKPVIDKQDYKSEVFIQNSYMSRGLYHVQIKRYLRYFTMDNILVINSESFFAEPHITLRQIFQFIGVDTEFMINNLKPHNVGSNKTEIDPKAYKYLENYFQPQNKLLYELIGQNYNW